MYNNSAKIITGFTLIELMVTLSIATIVMVMAIPSFSTSIKNNRLTTQVNQFVTGINLARSEAIRRGMNVTLCKSSDGGSCVTTGNWSQGFIVFTDQDSNGTYTSSTETLLKIFGSAPTQISVTGNTAVASAISYKSNGMTSNGTLTFCDDRSGAFGKKIVVNNGRPRIDGNQTCP
jgi:type IV fimbrial biogenesis protein FimT